jgi:hypothetical protein
MAATRRRRRHVIPPAVEATGEVLHALARWVKAHAELEVKDIVYDRLRREEHERAAAAWRSYEAARRWEADRWADVCRVVPRQTREAYRLGDVTVYCTAIDRRGLTLRAVRGGELIRTE